MIGLRPSSGMDLRAATFGPFLVVGVEDSMCLIASASLLLAELPSVYLLHGLERLSLPSFSATSTEMREVSIKVRLKYFMAACASSAVRYPTNPNCREVPSLSKHKLALPSVGFPPNDGLKQRPNPWPHAASWIYARGADDFGVGDLPLRAEVLPQAVLRHVLGQGLDADPGRHGAAPF